MFKSLASIVALGLIALPASAGYYPELAAMSVARSVCEAWSAGASFKEGIAYAYRANSSIYREEHKDPMFSRIVTAKTMNMCLDLMLQKSDEDDRLKQK